MLGLGLSVPEAALRRAGAAPPPISTRCDRTTSTVDATVRRVDRA